MYKFLLSMRFFRLRKINLLSVICIALGVMVLIIVYSVLEGFQNRLKDAFRKTTPHVVVEDISAWRPFEEYADVLVKSAFVVLVNRPGQATMYEPPLSSTKCIKLEFDGNAFSVMSLGLSFEHKGDILLLMPLALNPETTDAEKTE